MSDHGLQRLARAKMEWLGRAADACRSREIPWSAGAYGTAKFDLALSAEFERQKRAVARERAWRKRFRELERRAYA